MNRLHLDFHLETTEERNQFVTEYLQRDEFIRRPPTSSELETISNYILWGKDPKTGQNFVKDKLGEIETRNKTWTNTTNIESLDALLENPNFNEGMINPVVQTKKIRESFNRSKALAQCPDYLKEQLTNLFHLIDSVDLGIEYYEIIHGKRKREIRPALMNAFDPDEKLRILRQAESWNQYYYLKQKHLLVELRREQFTLRDSFITVIQRNTLPVVDCAPTTSDFDSDIPVLPLGVAHPLIFRPLSQLNPFAYQEKELAEVSRYLWHYKERPIRPEQCTFDFREKEHVYQLFLKYFDVEDSGLNNEDKFNNTNKLLDALMYYIELADLSDIHRFILQQKMEHQSNINIAYEVNKRFGKTYSANYISTIFKQKIIEKINAAAARHLEIVENLFFEENFKQCSRCGQWLLRDNTSFVKKTRSPDGLNTRCKKCDKEIRQNKKEQVK